MSSVNLNELRDKAYQCALVHGWHEDNLSDEHFLCLVISELMEAVEADRKGMHADYEPFKYYMNKKSRSDDEFIYAFGNVIKDTVCDELADACIRMLDLAGLRNIDLGKVNIDTLKYKGCFFDLTFTEAVFKLVDNITNLGYIEGLSFNYHLRVTLLEILIFCAQKDIDIFFFIDLKMRYNELRSYRHGGKAY